MDEDPKQDIYNEVEAEMPNVQVATTDEVAAAEQEQLNTRQQTGEQAVETAPEISADAPAEPVVPQNVETLDQSMAELTGGDQGQQPFGLPPVSTLPQPPKPGETITPEQYQQNVIQTADSLVNIKIAAFQNANRIKEQLGEAQKDYPQLDKRSKDSFDPELSTSITQASKAFIKANPTGDVKGFIDNMMKPYQRSLEKQATRQQETVTKQVHQTALRPTQVKSVEKKPEDMTIEEMEKKFGIAY